MLAGIRWVLFDAVGTLIFPHPPVAEVYYAAGRRFGSRLGIKTIQQRFRLALAEAQSGCRPTSESGERERWRRIVGRVIDDVPEVLDAVFDELWRHFSQPQHWRVYDDVPEALSALARRGFQLGIASNFDQRLIEIAAGHPPLANCAPIFVSSDMGYTKPDLRFFRAVEERLRVPPAEIALIGDNEASDVQGAIAAGWRAIPLDRDEPVAAGTIQTLAELNA
jgi:putative hydrolase of the HAD superfamily